MFRLVNKPISYFGLAAVVVALPLWWRMHYVTRAAVASSAIDASAAEKQAILVHAGLDARSLAAAGVSSNSISASVQALATYLESQPTTLSSADTAVAIARKESDRLLRLIQAGKSSGEDITQYQTQSAALASATSQQEAALNAVVEATTANFTQQQRATLSTIRGNSANAEVSVEFRTVNRSKAEWLQLRDDLAAERILAEHGEQPFAEGQARLATARANETVAAAKTALETNLAAITSALHAATSGD